MKTIVRLSMLVCATLFCTSAFAAGDDVQWKRVERMDPGTKIAVGVDGGATAERYFVQLSDSELVVLNLTGAELPKRQLIEMTKDNPSWMAGTATSTYKDNSLRVGPEGVFVKDRKVGDLNDVVLHIPRSKVTAIKG